MSADPLLRLPALGVRRVLAAALDARRRQAAGEAVAPPFLSVALLSGHAFAGWLVAMGEEDGRGVCLFQRARDSALAPDALYVALERIEAVTVHEAAEIADLLSGGTVARPLPPPPTRLELRRQAAALAERLATLSGHPLEVVLALDGLEPPDWPALPMALVLVEAALRHVARDAAGRGALAELDRLELRAAPLSVTRQGGTLALALPWDGATPLPSATDLAERISGLL